MKLSEERIYYLLKSYSEKSATEAEKVELYEWVANTSDESVLRQHVKELISRNRDATFPKVDWDDIYQQILDNTQEEMVSYPQERKIGWKIAAAVLILIIGGGIVYLFSIQHKTNQQQTVVKNTTPIYDNNIKPGSTKAMLSAGHQSVVLNTTDTSFSLAGNKIDVNDGKIQVEKEKPVQYTLTVPRGGTYSLVLADGTKVWLNADSKLIYPSTFTGDTRGVELSGEGYFDVKTDAKHPFVIHTQAQDVQVLGTEVNIAAYENENMTTTLVRGKVAVRNGVERKVLKPGQQAILQKRTNVKKRTFVVQKADVKQVVAWKNGYFRFDRMDIRTIMNQLSRWYDIEVEYSGKMPDRLFGAIMNRKNNIARILELLEATGAVHFEIEGQTVKVSKQ